MGNLRYVLQSNIFSKRTYKTIRDILKRKWASHSPMVKTWRLGFTTDEPEAKALMVTANGYGVV